MNCSVCSDKSIAESYCENCAAAILALQESQSDQIARLTARVEQLRGLAQSAAGWLSEAGDGDHAARVLELVGDMEAGAAIAQEGNNGRA